jgi:hypothetical protein
VSLLFASVNAVLSDFKRMKSGLRAKYKTNVLRVLEPSLEQTVKPSPHSRNCLRLFATQPLVWADYLTDDAVSGFSGSESDTGEEFDELEGPNGWRPTLKDLQPYNASYLMNDLPLALSNGPFQNSSFDAGDAVLRLLKGTAETLERVHSSTLGSSVTDARPTPSQAIETVTVLYTGTKEVDKVDLLYFKVDEFF